MIILNHSNNLHKYLEQEKDLLMYRIKLQEKCRKIILNYIQDYTYSIDNISADNSPNIFEFLTILKNSLNLCNENICQLNNILSNFNKFISSLKENNECIDIQVESFNLSVSTSDNIIMKNTLEIENYLYSISEKFVLTFSNSEKNYELHGNALSDVSSSNENVSSISNFTSEITSETKNEDNENEEYKNVDKESKEENEEDNLENIIENTLIISEKSGSVTLPYSLSELNKTLKDEPQNYTSIYNVIQKKYTLPINLFKNSMVARFREAFKLVRNKEAGSIKDAFDLGMELFFCYNLHPAIITACRNLEELDIYLDYLDNAETEKFDCFKVVFEFAPTIVKSHQK